MMNPCQSFSPSSVPPFWKFIVAIGLTNRFPKSLVTERLTRLPFDSSWQRWCFREPPQYESDDGCPGRPQSQRSYPPEFFSRRSWQVDTHPIAPSRTLNQTTTGVRTWTADAPARDRGAKGSDQAPPHICLVSPAPRYRSNLRGIAYDFVPFDFQDHQVGGKILSSCAGQHNRGCQQQGEGSSPPPIGAWC